MHEMLDCVLENYALGRSSPTRTVHLSCMVIALLLVLADNWLLNFLVHVMVVNVQSQVLHYCHFHT